MKNNRQPQLSLGESNWLVEQHKPMVFHLVKKISNSLPFKVETEDLVAYGQLGLIEASQRFDPSHGSRFSTFAYYRIRGAIYDGLREMGAITRSHVHHFAINANDILTTETRDSGVGTNNVDDEIQTVENMIDALIPIYFLSLDGETTGEIEDEKAFTEYDFETRDLLERIREVLEELEPDDAELLKMVYFKKMKMKELANKMGVSKSWVSRLHARAIGHLQTALKSYNYYFPQRSKARKGRF